MNAVCSVYRDESCAVIELHLLLCCLSRCSWLDVLMYVSLFLGGVCTGNAQACDVVWTCYA